MFLKSLSIKGFKSFADSTTLDFEPGVTVVVGPNGSGKSNVVDAVAWVLGAQGPRTLRSSKMEDVIFAGTPKRPALGRAEVSLTIDNSAGLLPIDFSEVTITRTLFRSGDSEYAINSVPCRLLEIQELLSDTGVGRQQHVIVSQGNIDSVLNARPEDRRFVVEEAAGILKFRRRKERAERRLESTEAGLVRLQDLLREVRRQIRPLEKQADAARRHGDIAAELVGLQQYLLGRDLLAVESKIRAVERDRALIESSERVIRKTLTDLDADVLVAEASTESPLKRSGPDPADLLGRAEALRARARGVVAVVSERRRSLERELASTDEDDALVALQAEAVSLTGELARTEAEATSLLPDADALADAEAALVKAEADLEERWGRERSVAGLGEGAEIKMELAALQASLERSTAEMARLHQRLDASAVRYSRLIDDIDALEERGRRAEAEASSLTGLAEAHREAEKARDDILRRSEEALRAADIERGRWAARAEALESALAQARARAGVERLSGLTGVLGTLLDLVEVDAGYEAAFESAAGEVLGGVVVDDTAAGRRALETLRSHIASGSMASGAVIPLGITGNSSRAGRAADEDVSPGAGLEPLRRHVRARLASVGALLAEMLASVVVTDAGWDQAIDLALANPTLVVVTRDGDRFGQGIWRTNAGANGATLAALEEARDRSSRAAAECELRAATLTSARQSAEQARADRSAAERRLDSTTAESRSCADSLRRSLSDFSEVESELHAIARHCDELGITQAVDISRLEELQALMPEVERRSSFAEHRAAAEREARAELGQRMVDVSASRRELEVRAAGLEERRLFTERRLRDVDERIRERSSALSVAIARRAATERAAVVTSCLSELVASRLDGLEGAVGVLALARDASVAAQASRTSRLESLRRRRGESERELGETRERSSRLDVEMAESRVRLEATVEAIRRELDSEPDAVRGAIPPELPAGSSATSRRAELERELRLMGPINPLALEEHQALLERNAFLEEQLEDVRAARRELSKVIRAVDTEIVEMFQAAYTDVANNFERLFATLFPGGEGRLRLSEPERPLDTGIEIEARPSGKNLRRLSLLSGGERSLAAMAFLFSVFRARPSPFYMLDEVEAALDDVNLHRFLDLVQEFRDEAQLLIVSHQKRTMEAADCLYGVTMAPGGSSRVVSERTEVGASRPASASAHREQAAAHV